MTDNNEGGEKTRSSGVLALENLPLPLFEGKISTLDN